MNHLQDDPRSRQSSRKGLRPALWLPMLQQTLWGMMLFSSCFFTVPPSSAQVRTPSPLEKLTQLQESEEAYLPLSIFNDVARELQFSPNDKRLRALFSPEERKALKTERAKKADSSPEPGKSKVLFHVKKKKGGSPVVSLEDILAPHRKRYEEDKFKARAMLVEQVRRQQQKLKESMVLKALPNCGLSKTEQTVFPNSLPGREGTLIGDFLFIPPSYPTRYAADLYGEETQLIVYDTSKPSPFRLVVEAYRVPCLPYRVRAIGSHLFEHFGDDAVKNFDGDPYGNGENLL